MALKDYPQSRSKAEPYKDLFISMQPMRDKMEKIDITVETKSKIKKLAEKYGYKNITTLEYLLNGKINIKEL